MKILDFAGEKNMFVIIMGLVLLGALIGYLVISNLPILPLTTDAVRYDEAGMHIAETGNIPLQGGQVLPPGYPYFLGTIYNIFGHTYAAVYLIQFVLIGLCGAMTFYIARALFRVPMVVSVLVGTMVTLWPYMVLHAMLVLSEVLGITLLLMGILALLTFLKTPKMRLVVLSGFLFGLSTLVRPVSMLLPFWISILTVMYYKMSKETFAFSKKTAVAFLMPFLMLPTGWSVYLSLSQGLSDGIFSHVPSVIAKSLNLTYEEAPPERIEDLIASQNNVVEGIDAVIPKPSFGVVIASKLKNVFLFWNPGAGGYQAQAYIDRYPFVSVLIWLYRIGFLILLALAFLTLRRWREPMIALLWMIVFYFWGLHSMLFPYPRYMLPLIPIVLILSGITFTSFLPQIQTRCVHLLTAVQRRTPEGNN